VSRIVSCSPRSAAPPPYQWSFAGDGANPGLDDFDPVDLAIEDGVLTGIPTSVTTASAHVEATDANGDSHTKLFVLEVVAPGPPTTATSTTTTTTAPLLPGDIPCVIRSTTTTSQPSDCLGRTGFPGAECWTWELNARLKKLPAPPRALVRAVRRVDWAIGVARSSAAYVVRPRPRRVRVWLRRASRRIEALVALTREPEVVASIGAAEAQALAALAERIGRLARAELETRKRVRGRDG
jgi:hypothetical protein